MLSDASTCSEFIHFLHNTGEVGHGHTSKRVSGFSTYELVQAGLERCELGELDMFMSSRGRHITLTRLIFLIRHAGNTTIMTDDCSGCDGRKQARQGSRQARNFRELELVTSTSHTLRNRVSEAGAAYPCLPCLQSLI